MKRAAKLSCALLLLVAAAGCWNMQEPDRLAFIIGAGMDITEDGKLEISSQVAVPAGASGGEGNGSRGANNKRSFIVVAATGKNVMDAGQNIQSDLSRSLFYAHRQTILIGRRLAEHGLGKTTDMFIRNPKSEMRSVILVVKNAQAKDVLNIDPIFDPYLSVTFVRGEDVQGVKPYYYRQFLSDTLSDGRHPLLPAISVTPAKKYIYSGSAILNKDKDLKLAGFLNTHESFLANWIIGRQSGFTVTSFIPQGKGEVSLRVQQLKRKIRVKTGENGLQIDVRLNGVGTVIENQSTLEPTVAKDIRFIEEAVNASTQKAVQQLIEKGQKQYKTDFFAFGEVIHRSYPRQWKTLKHNWDKTFPGVQVTSKVSIKCKEPGQTNSTM